MNAIMNDSMVQAFTKCSLWLRKREPGTGELKLAGKVHQAPETPSLPNTN